ncbi:MAG TPA: DUF1801 domain-containing protein [Phycisphaerales bacterium]|nr:DUF1801 domain-containing protein [Phycisphaerales bacterium]
MTGANGVNEWFAALPKGQGPALAAVRKMVLASSKGVDEEMKWGRPCYSSGSAGLFCYLHSTRNHGTLGFHKGASLKDPKALLEGAGKEMRHIKIKSMGDVDAAAFKALLKQAAGG